MQKTGGVLQLQVWAELGQGALFPSQAEVARIARVNVAFACNASLVSLVSEFQYSYSIVSYSIVSYSIVSTVTVSSKTSLGNLPYFSLRTNIL